MPESFFLTSECAEQAVNLVLPTIKAMMEGGQTDSQHLHIVVLNPTKLFYGNVGEFPKAILYEFSLGERTQWEHPYDKIARGKASISWRTGLPSHAVQQLYPYLYIKEDTKYGGSAVLPGGLVAAASGTQWWFDQYFSECVLAACKALCVAQVQAFLSKEENRKVHFFGGQPLQTN